MANQPTKPNESDDLDDRIGSTLFGDVRPGEKSLRQNNLGGWLFMLLLLLLAGGAAWWWWNKQSAPVAPLEAPRAASAAAPATVPAPPVAAAPSAPASVTEPEPKPVETPLASAADIRTALTDLLGGKAVNTWLNADDFPRRLATTVDNMAREHAPSRLWPVVPTAGRFTVVEQQGIKTIDPNNAKRYAPFVQALESVDSAAAASLYVRMLPALQRAYEELGFPGKRFHTRLLEVIDHLLAAPQPTGLIEVQLTEVRGEVPSTRPWVRYEFADPKLESASAGHKLMVRMGADHQRRVKAKLKALRAELVQRAKA